MVNKEYDIIANDALGVEEPTANYGITISITVPSMGGYTFESLKHELTEFARKLVSNQVAAENIKKSSWKTMSISDKVKKMSLGKSNLSTDNRTTKQLLEKSLQEKFV